MKKILLILGVGFFFILPCTLKAQVKSIFQEVEYSDRNSGKVRIVQDDKLQTLVEKHQWENSKTHEIIGYRIRVFSDSGPDAKNEFEYTKARFSESFSKVKIHQEFVYPFYKIYVGDFRSRSEALKLLTQMEGGFPDAFIVQTKINYPNLVTE